MNEIQLSEHFSYGKLLRFTLPSIVMMVFSSMYSVVDGIFVSNFVGKTPFAAINLIMPFLMMFAALGFMFGTGWQCFGGENAWRGQSEKGEWHIFHACLYADCGRSVSVGSGSHLHSGYCIMAWRGRRI